MGIKSRSKPLQFKNVNVSFSNKESIQKYPKTIKILTKEKIKAVTSQDKYNNSKSQAINSGNEEQMMTEEDYHISSSILMDDDDDDDDDLPVNSISLLDEGNRKEQRNINNSVDPQYDLVNLEGKYVTKIPQYIIKKSIDYFSLSILQETTVETEINNGSPNFVSTPIHNGNGNKNRNDISNNNNNNSLDRLTLDDIDRSIFWDIFNSSQIENYPRILPPSLITSKKNVNCDDSRDDDDDMMIIESDSSLNGFYHSYGHIPKRHFNIHTPLKILHPASPPPPPPLPHSSSSSSFSSASS